MVSPGCHPDPWPVGRQSAPPASVAAVRMPAPGAHRLQHCQALAPEPAAEHELRPVVAVAADTPGQVLVGRWPT